MSRKYLFPSTASTAFLIVLATVLSSPAQSVSSLLGKWKEKRVNGDDFIECPYQIQFTGNRNYKIFNVCYGMDPTLPMTEEGNWRFDVSKKMITLSNRKALDGSELYLDSTRVLKLQVKEFKLDLLTIIGESKLNKKQLIVAVQKVE